MEKILLIEDDLSLLEIYKIYLKKAGYKVDIAVNKPMALEKVKSIYPDLILLDLNLNAAQDGPQDGLEILKALRSDAKTKDTKVIILSNYNKEDWPELAELDELGIKKYFIKAETLPEELALAIKESLYGSVAK